MTEEEGLRRHLTLVLLFGAATKDANDRQLHQLQVFPDLIKDQSISLKDVGARIFEVMGPMWTPNKEFTEYIDALQKQDKEAS